MNYKNRIITLALVLFSYGLSAQDDTATARIKEEIRALFVKADKTDLQNVLTYKVDGKTGFVNAKTDRSLLEPTPDLEEVTLFNPDMKGIYKGEYQFEVSGQDFEIKVIKHFDEPVMDVSMQPASEQSRVEVISSANGYKGFMVDKKGVLTAYSDLYQPRRHHVLNIEPFLFEGKYYAIVMKRTGPGEYVKGIIDTDGNPLPHFNFVHKCLTLIKQEPGDIWFFFGLCGRPKGSLLSFKGKAKYTDELVGHLYNGLNIFGYNHNCSEDWKVHGIFDIEKLNWVLKPQTTIQIMGLGYSSKEVLNTASIEDRAKAKVYFLVKDGEKEFYMDLNRKTYFPKK